MLTVGEHDTLWKEGAKSIGKLDDRLISMTREIRLSNYRDLLKELYSLNEISKNDYIVCLKQLWNHEQVFGTFDEVFNNNNTNEEGEDAK